MEKKEITNHSKCNKVKLDHLNAKMLAKSIQADYKVPKWL
jgi:molybdopterin biosynthesis enzyme